MGGSRNFGRCKGKSPAGNTALLSGYALVLHTLAAVSAISPVCSVSYLSGLYRGPYKPGFGLRASSRPHIPVAQLRELRAESSE